MKVLINLVGLSHHDVGNGLHSYKSVCANLFKNLVNPLEEKHQVDFTLKTYHTDEESNILSVYKPITSEFVGEQPPFDTYIQSVECLKNYDYDFFIVSRFDLDIKVPLDIDFTKFNFLFKELDWWDTHQCTTDTFYAFPRYMLKWFELACKDAHSKRGYPGYLGLLHGLHKDLVNYVDEDNIHFIDSEKQTIQTSTKYSLSRYGK